MTASRHAATRHAPTQDLATHDVGPTSARALRGGRGRRIAALLSLLVLATLAPGTVGPQSASAASCTGWRSTVEPPETIRVLRTHGPAAGRVQTVSFRTYVNIVMPAEWGPQHPREVLRAGAVAIKQYAWYHVLNWRGRSAAGGCYDVVDSTNDQVYSPETKRPAPAHVSAVDATWNWSMRRDGRFFPSGYRAGASVECGADASGTVMYQNGASRCGRDGKSAVEILTIYYGNPELEVLGAGESASPATPVNPAAKPAATPKPTPKPTPTPTPKPAAPSGLVGDGDSTGDRIGDVITVTKQADATGAETRIYASGLAPGGGGPVRIALAQPPATALGTSAGDASGDGLDDLVALMRSDDGSLRVEVAVASVGGALSPPTVWWQGVPGDFGWGDGTAIRFVVADVDGDKRGDALLLVSAGDPNAPDIVWRLPSSGTSFGAAVPWWLGAVDVEGAALYAGDLDADRRTDVVIQTDLARATPAGTGVRYSVIRGGSVGGDGLAAPAVSWLDLADVNAAQARVTVSDVNRDRRHDLVIARPFGTSGTQIVGLISTGGGFTRRTLWQATTGFRWAASHLAGADVNGDGRGDIVMVYNLGAAGSRFFRFVSDGSTLRVAGSTTDPTLAWAATSVY